MHNINDEERNGGTAARKPLRTAVKAASLARSWAEAQLEWDIAGPPDIDEDCGSVCVCEQQGLKFLFRVHNTTTGAELYPIGSTCIVEHFGAAPRMMARLATLRAIAGLTVDMRTHHGHLDLRRDVTPTRISALLAEGVLDADRADRLMTLRRRRKPLTIPEHELAERLLREAVAPALGGDPAAEIVETDDFHGGYGAGYRGETAPEGATSAWLIGHHDGARMATDLGGAA